MMQYLPTSRASSFVAPVVLAFHQTRQLALVTDTLDGSLTKEQEVVQRLSSLAVSESQRTGSPSSVAAKINRRSSTVLLCVPVSTPEQVSGRLGLCVVVGLLAISRRSPSVRLVAQVIQLLECLLLEVAGEPGGSVPQAMDRLTRDQQLGVNDSSTRRIAEGAKKLCQFASIMLDADGQSRPRWLVGESVAEDDEWAQAGTDALVRLGCFTYKRYLTDHRDQLGHYFHISRLFSGQPPTASGRSSYVLANDGLYVTQHLTRVHE